ncbi:hypothetical protein [Streptomyces sp. NPDC056061]|uniref:hypothetical protein n=1 Tax=Streptomyces sp. NPDC056061 TaxID=3345700 RepID=UPI0035D5BBCE
MSADLSELSTGAVKWKETAAKFKKLADQYERDVHGISIDDSWVGLSAQAANGRFTVTLKEIRGAHQEAKAIAEILRDAHAELTDLRKRVEAVRDDATGAGMRVSDSGVVAFDSTRLTQSERMAYVHDPSFQESARTAADEWAQRLAQAVKAVSEADDGIRLALDAAVLDSDLMDGTLNGFNRKATAGPYPSLQETGKAAHMPKARKDVAKWWRDLDPVTRGILLQERGDELRAAGIMDPQYQWHAPDPGSGPFGVEKPTARDLKYHAWAIGIAAAGDFAGENQASRNMMHYLGGTGEPLELDVNSMLHDDASFRSNAERMHIAEYRDEWNRKALKEFEKAGGDKLISMPVETVHSGGTFTDASWFHAVGSHEQNISGMVTVEPGDDGRPTVSLEYQVNVWDRYNWDKGKSTDFPGGIVIEDKDMGHLHTVGIAQEFDMRGSSATFTHDLSSDTYPAMKPDVPGRAGSRGDVSRGDEGNR